MTVTKIEPLTKTRFQVFVDDSFAFVLYKGELSRYDIKEQEVVSQDTYLKIKEKVILKRGKLRALHLLNDMGRTRAQLCTKLKQDHYTEDIIEQVLSYVSSFGYINDQEYAKNYIMRKQHTKSKREIRMGLCQKGVDRDLIEATLEECYEMQEEGERAAIHALLKKKKFHAEEATEQEMLKICGFLARKGFRYGDIRQVIQVSARNA